MSGYIEVSETALPEVYFVATDSITCSGIEIQFADMSSNCPDIPFWEFDPSNVNFINGTTQSSQSPDVEFPNAGSYSVTLSVTNNAGTNSFTKEDYIQIGGIAVPFYDDFESGSLNTKSWIIENPDFNVTWDMAAVAGNGSSHAACMNFFDYLVPPGSRDRMITPVMTFENMNQVYLSFQHAYAKRHSSVTDSLIVLISNDCGNTWTRLWANGDDGNGIFATHELTTSPFVPEVAEDWCGTGWGADCVFLDLSEWAG
ncbi:MAG: PKD domain-containing protein [Bacteroidales bacterium]